ncbi:DUF6292 family protein [Amycolatopsis magusensis]|uniref:DUF6292 family protein n=1 Tax=Amycolatopsis magusensis TaxID=882444 RepID=UPI0024A95AE7|nr:DUF6292 family protein [Amycolatopsis magusensis]MDI5979648.1 DUF6292 family protein [Amycolatopsis magusensis]
MNIEFDLAAARGLAWYVREVAAELGLGGGCFFVQLDSPAHAYVAIDERLPRFPDRDLALVWDEEHGWALAVETASAEDLIVLAYLGGDVLPPPAVVARFACLPLSAVRLTSPEPPVLRRTGDHDDLVQRLGRCAFGGQGGQAHPFVHLAG